VVSTNYNTTSMVRTMEDILGVNYLGLNDANARPMSDVFTTTPDLTPYIAIIPGILCAPPVDPTLVPECKNLNGREVTAAVKPLHDGVWWAKATQRFNFKRPDLNNPELFNRVLWRGIMGDDKPYPGAGSPQIASGSRQTSAPAVKTVADRD
jgi:DNA-binding beta-propeller fold protein YncE